MVLYALHDAIEADAGRHPSPSLAESWSAGEDGLSYEFVLRKGAKFHNGDPVTADDVKFSFERYRGAAHSLLKERVVSVETPDPQRVVFKLKNPWPDFVTFYTVASGAGWIVPRKYVEKVGEDNFKKAPVGAGPYKFVSFTPGIELVMEAFDQYWRKTPAVSRVVLKVIPDESTRLAALKNGEIDIAYSIRAELAEELQRTPGLTLRMTVGSAPCWLYFPEQWDAKSPWHDPRVRLASKYALDYTTINKALTLGYSQVTGSIIPENFEFDKLPAPINDRTRRETAGRGRFAGGFDAGFYTCDVAYADLGEAAELSRPEVGIRAKLRPLERAAFFKGYAERSSRIIVQGSSVRSAIPPRLEEFVVKGGAYAYGAIRRSMSCSRSGGRTGPWQARRIAGEDAAAAG